MVLGEVLWVGRDALRGTKSSMEQEQANTCPSPHTPATTDLPLFMHTGLPTKISSEEIVL